MRENFGEGVTTMHETVTRRQFLGSAAAGVAGAAAPSRRKLREFAYGDVRLTDGPIGEMYRRTQAHFLGLDEDRILKVYRQRAGLPAPGRDMSVSPFPLFPKFRSLADLDSEFRSANRFEPYLPARSRSPSLDFGWADFSFLSSTPGSWLSEKRNLDYFSPWAFHD